MSTLDRSGKFGYTPRFTSVRANVQDIPRKAAKQQPEESLKHALYDAPEFTFTSPAAQRIMQRVGAAATLSSLAALDGYLTEAKSEEPGSRQAGASSARPRRKAKPPPTPAAIASQGNATRQALATPAELQQAEALAGHTLGRAKRVIRPARGKPASAAVGWFQGTRTLTDLWRKCPRDADGTAAPDDVLHALRAGCAAAADAEASRAATAAMVQAATDGAGRVSFRRLAQATAKWDADAVPGGKPRLVLVDQAEPRSRSGPTPALDPAADTPEPSLAALDMLQAESRRLGGGGEPAAESGSQPSPLQPDASSVATPGVPHQVGQPASTLRAQVPPAQAQPSALLAEQRERALRAQRARQLIAARAQALGGEATGLRRLFMKMPRASDGGVDVHDMAAALEQAGAPVSAADLATMLGSARVRYSEFAHAVDGQANAAAPGTPGWAGRVEPPSARGGKDLDSTQDSAAATASSVAARATIRRVRDAMLDRMSQHGLAPRELWLKMSQDRDSVLTVQELAAGLERIGLPLAASDLQSVVTAASKSAMARRKTSHHAAPASTVSPAPQQFVLGDGLDYPSFVHTFFPAAAETAEGSLALPRSGLDPIDQLVAAHGVQRRYGVERPGLEEEGEEARKEAAERAAERGTVFTSLTGTGTLDTAGVFTGARDIEQANVAVEDAAAALWNRDTREMMTDGVARNVHGQSKATCLPEGASAKERAHAYQAQSSVQAVAEKLRSKGDPVQLWRRLNPTRDGGVDAAELRLGLARLGVATTPAQFRAFHAACAGDTSGPGADRPVSYANFSAVVRNDPLPDAMAQAMEGQDPLRADLNRFGRKAAAIPASARHVDASTGRVTLRDPMHSVEVSAAFHEQGAAACTNLVDAALANALAERIDGRVGGARKLFLALAAPTPLDSAYAAAAGGPNAPMTPAATPNEPSAAADWATPRSVASSRGAASVAGARAAGVPVAELQQRLAQAGVPVSDKQLAALVGNFAGDVVDYSAWKQMLRPRAFADLRGPASARAHAAATFGAAALASGQAPTESGAAADLPAGMSAWVAYAPGGAAAGTTAGGAWGANDRAVARYQSAADLASMRKLGQIVASEGAWDGGMATDAGGVEVLPAAGSAPRAAGRRSGRKVFHDLRQAELQDSAGDVIFGRTAGATAARRSRSVDPSARRRSASVGSACDNDTAAAGMSTMERSQRVEPSRRHAATQGSSGVARLLCTPARAQPTQHGTGARPRARSASPRLRSAARQRDCAGAGVAGLLCNPQYGGAPRRENRWGKLVAE